MKTRGLMLAAGALLGLSSAAMAQFTATNAGPLDSNGPAGSPLNGMFTFNYGGPAFRAGVVNFSGNLTEVNLGTFASEARWRITNPAGVSFNTGQLSAIGGFDGTLAVATNFSVVLPLSDPASSVGQWTFQAFESFDDGSDLLVDAIWDNVSFTFNTFVPPVPPPSISLGVIGDTSSDYLVPDAMRTHTGGAVTWYSFTLSEAVSNAAGLFLDIDTETSTFDTEIGLYRADGSLVANDDDDGTGTQSQLTFGLTSPTRAIGTSVGGNGRDGGLEAGTYYIAVGGFNTNFGPAGFEVTTTSTNTTGIVNLNLRTNVIPAPGAFALLGLGGLVAARRRRN